MARFRHLVSGAIERGEAVAITEQPRHELSYDGRGINGPDIFRSRIATFYRNDQGQSEAKHYGPLFATSPELLAALEEAMVLMPLGTGRRARWFAAAGTAIADAKAGRT